MSVSNLCGVAVCLESYLCVFLRTVPSHVKWFPAWILSSSCSCLCKLFTPVWCGHLAGLFARTLIFCWYSNKLFESHFCIWVHYPREPWHLILTSMDSADQTSLRAAVELQGMLLGCHLEELAQACHTINALAVQVMEHMEPLRLLQPVQHNTLSPVSHYTTSHEPYIDNTPIYAGEPTNCFSFLIQCKR